MATLPARGEAVRSLGLPLPPARMPLVRARRPLKRWRYVGVYTPEVMVCAAEAFVGPLAQRFWAIAEPSGGLLAGRALLGSGGVAVGDGRVRVRARSGGGSGSKRGARVQIDLTLAAEAGGPPAVESVAPHGADGYVWTRKLVGARASGTVVVDGRVRALEGGGAIDETAGYHARHTRWRWSAGVGRGAGGERIGWNLVEGVNDDPQGSERTVWVDGEPREVPAQRFAEDLSGVGGLRFDEWCAREHRTRRGPFRSDYRQPFGAFSGILPGGLELESGYGVMEWHDVRW